MTGLRSAEPQATEPAFETDVLIAVTRRVPRDIESCALTFLDRDRIDLEQARREHRDYEDTLRRLGVQLVSLEACDELPDSTFVEDTAVVLDEVAVITNPFLESRKREVDSVSAVLAEYRPLVRLSTGGTLEGGDVLRIGRRIFVGQSARTNQAGIAELRELVGPLGYEVVSVRVPACLHLKTGCTYIGRDTILVNQAWIDIGSFEGLTCLAVPVEEPFAANVLLVGNALIVPDCFPLTTGLLRQAGYEVVSVGFNQLQKAEAGLTCCSLLFRQTQPGRPAEHLQ